MSGRQEEALTGTDLLKVHKRRLEQVIAENAFACTTNRARKWLRLVNGLLSQPHRHDEALLMLGPNWHGPALDDLYRAAAKHSAWNEPVEETVSVGEAA